MDLANLEVSEIDLYDKNKNLELERNVLAYLLLKDVSILSLAKREYFTIETHRLLFDILMVSRSNVTYQHVRNFFKKTYDEDDFSMHIEIVKKIYRKEISEYNPKNMTLLIDNLSEHYMLREAVAMSVGVLKAVKEKKTNEVFQSIGAYNAKRPQSGTIQSGEYVEDFENRVTALQYLKENIDIIGCKTGIKKLDDVIGAMKPTEWGLLVGDTGAGKSVMLESFGINNYRDYNKNVLFVSLEMPKLQVFNRADANIAEIAYKHFRVGDASCEDMTKWKRKIEELKERRNKFCVAYMRRSSCANDIRDEAYRLQDQYGVAFDMILIDYLNLMKSNNAKSTSKDWSDMSDVSWDIKQLAAEFNDIGTVIWTPNQRGDGDKSNKDGVVTKREIKYARAILEHCPFCIGIAQTQDDVLENTLTVNIIKSRDTGETGMQLTLKPEFDFMRFSEVESATRSGGAHDLGDS